MTTQSIGRPGDGDEPDGANPDPAPAEIDLGTSTEPDPSAETDVSAAKDTARRKRPWWAELAIMLVGAFLLTFLIQTFFFKVYYVPSGSMEQTLHGATSGGDRILVNKLVYNFRDPAPGDIVVFKGPPTWTPEISIKGPTSLLGKAGQLLGSVIGITPPNERDFVKRVIAVGGQTVSCCDAAGNVTVDGASLNEPYIYEPIPFVPGKLDCGREELAGPGRTGISQRCFGPVTVPAGQLWMMGDHRSASGDSTQGCQWGRDPTYCQGPVPVDNVIGKAIYVIMPLSHWTTLGDPGIDLRGQALPLTSGPLPLTSSCLLGTFVIAWPRSRQRRARARAASR